MPEPNFYRRAMGENLEDFEARLLKVTGGPRLKQLIEEVRREPADDPNAYNPNAYDRIHSRHNRSM